MSSSGEGLVRVRLGQGALACNRLRSSRMQTAPVPPPRPPCWRRWVSEAVPVVMLAAVLELVAAGSGWQLSTDPRLVGQPFEHRASAAVALGVAIERCDGSEWQGDGGGDEIVARRRRQWRAAKAGESW